MTQSEIYLKAAEVLEEDAHGWGDPDDRYNMGVCDALEIVYDEDFDFNICFNEWYEAQERFADLFKPEVTERAYWWPLDEEHYYIRLNILLLLSEMTK